MTISDILTIILMALLDALNPATIGTLFVILPIVKKKWYTLFFVFGTFMVYLAAGLAIYFGIDKVLKDFFIRLVERFDFYIGIIELILGAAALVFAIIFLVRLIKRLIKRQSSQKDYMAVVVKVVNPFSLLGLAIVSTMTDVPTALPYFAVMGILTTSNLGWLITIVTLILYCLVYILPMLILYVLFNRIKEEKFTKVAAKFKSIINKSTEYMIPIFLLAIGVFLVINAWGRVF